MASNMNVCILEGNLTRDAELSYTKSGTALCKFSVANNIYQGQERGEYTNYFDCIMWGRRAEALNQYLTKGKGVVLQCEARQERWEGEGGKRSRVTFTVTSIAFKGGGTGNGGARTASVSADGGFQDDNQATDPDDFDDDIPF